MKQSYYESMKVYKISRRSVYLKCNLRKTLVHISWQLAIAKGKKCKIERDNRKYMKGFGGKVSKPSIFFANKKEAYKTPG